ncbi:MAG: hypothetical protein NC311_00520 [Muribaculaceae bacterium]|nr:hypothetical protein [Muribaculaceae bacterium]
MGRTKTLDAESQRFTIILKVDRWDFHISRNKYQRDKDWPEPEIMESWNTKATVIYSDCPKYKVGDEINVWIGVNYDYMVYNLRKDFRFADPERPDNEKASISYDELEKYKEEHSYKVAGSISGDQLLSRAPKEIADRLAACPQMCSYIDLWVYRKKGQRDWLVQSFAISSSIDLSDYV